MRKEVLWAIVAGIIFGLALAFGLARINSFLKPKGEASESISSPTQGPAEFKITIDKPENGDVVTKDAITVSGITKPKTVVVISGEKNDDIVSSDDKGFFEKEIDLTAGVNQIIFTAFNPAGLPKKEKVLIISSPAFEEKEGDRFEKAANKPHGYLGTVTDITDSTIQIRTISSEIKQISVGGNLNVIKTTPTSKMVKLTDIAIGDFIVAMGYKNGNHVLAAQRILITPPLTEPKVTVAKAAGANVTPAKNTLVYSFKDGQVTKTKASAVKDESQVITVTVETDGQSSLRTVFVVE